jgi:hypothetical protein
MAPQGFFPESIPLSEDELRSLHWISMVNTRVAIPVTHIPKLLDGGYVREGADGPVLTDLGLLRLIHERNKKATLK